MNSTRVVLATLLIAAAASAEVAPSLSVKEAFHAHPPAMVTAFSSVHNAATRVPVLHALPALSAEERARLTRPAATGSIQAIPVGVVRTVPGSVGLRAAAAELPSDPTAPVSGGVLDRLADDTFVWTAGFSSAGAGAIRLNLSHLEPRDASVYVYARDGEVHGPYTAAQIGDGFWTNTVFASEVFAEVRFKIAGGSQRVHLEIGELLHLEHANFAPPGGDDVRASDLRDQHSCFQQTPCVPSSEFSQSALLDRARAIGAMEYVKDGAGWVCTGGLLNDQDDSTTTPWFLTADHCISTQAVANTLEVFWDYARSSCNGAAPNKSSMPRQLGAQFVTGSEPLDFSLLRLNSTPPGSRWYLGWNAGLDLANTADIQLYRLSHPDGEPLHYSRATSLGTVDAPRYAGYVFSAAAYGAVAGGSSGSPVFTFGSDGAQVVGSLSGVNAATEADLEAYCSYEKYVVRDSGFRAAMGQMAPYLSGVPSQPQPCVPNASTTCLVNDRFSVRVTYDVGNGPQPMTAIKFTPNSGLFWFTDAGNIEVLVKMINACAFNNRFWVYSGGTTDVGVTITVTDSQSGTSKTYNNPRGTKFGTITDGDAFATCP